LTDDLVENVHVLEIGHSGALAGEVSGGSALKAGVWESVHPGPVDIHRSSNIDNWLINTLFTILRYVNGEEIIVSDIPPPLVKVKLIHCCS
jgi:hypothetical protein